MSKPSGHWAERVYGLIVGLYPREFRERYGPAMKQTFRDLLDDPGMSASRIWRSVLGDLRDSFLHEHLANLIGGRFMTRWRGPRWPLYAALGLAVLFGFAMTFYGPYLPDGEGGWLVRLEGPGQVGLFFFGMFGLFFGVFGLLIGVLFGVLGLVTYFRRPQKPSRTLGQGASLPCPPRPQPAQISVSSGSLTGCNSTITIK